MRWQNTKPDILVDVVMEKYLMAVQLCPLPLLRQGFAVQAPQSDCTKNALIKNSLWGIF